MQTPMFIRQVADRMHRDADRAKRIIGVVLHELRDRLSEADAASLARHLPTALRPLWENNDRHPGTIEQPYRLELLGEVMESGAFPNSIEAERAVVAVFVVMQRRLDRVTGNTRVLSGIFDQLPHDLAVLWHAAEVCGADARRPATVPRSDDLRSHARSRASAA